MALNATALNAMLEELGTTGGLILFVSLHTDAVGGGDAAEVTGGAPAYIRKSITWSAAAAGNLDSSNQPAFDVPATTIQRVGFYSAESAGVYYGDADITNETYGGQGTYTLTDADISLT
jgi:hypothetical protein